MTAVVHQCLFHALGLKSELAAMLEEGGCPSHQCLPGTVVSISSEVLTLVKNINSQLYCKAFIVKLLKTGEERQLKNTEITTHFKWSSHNDRPNTLFQQLSTKLNTKAKNIEEFLLFSNGTLTVWWINNGSTFLGAHPAYG